MLFVSIPLLRTRGALSLSRVGVWVDKQGRLNLLWRHRRIVRRRREGWCVWMFGCLDAGVGGIGGCTSLFRTLRLEETLTLDIAGNTSILSVLPVLPVLSVLPVLPGLPGLVVTSTIREVQGPAHSTSATNRRASGVRTTYARSRPLVSLLCSVRPGQIDFDWIDREGQALDGEWEWFSSFRPSLPCTPCACGGVRQR